MDIADLYPVMTLLPRLLECLIRILLQVGFDDGRGSKLRYAGKEHASESE